MNQIETFAATRKGIRRYRLARDGSGVESALLCGFIGCVTHVFVEEDKGLTLRVLARSCRNPARLAEIEIGEKTLRYPRRVHSLLMGRGGIDFFIHSGNVAAVCRALMALTPADCAAAERELIGTAQPP